MNPNELIQRYLHGQATDPEIAELDRLLASDPALRRRLIVEMGIDAGLCEIARERAAQPSVVARRRSVWLSWRPLMAAAAGIVFGMFCTSMVFGYVVPRTMQKLHTVLSEGFESGVAKTAPGLPRETSRWSGDEVEVVASATGAKAHGGAKMLRFVSATYPGENSPRSQWGDVYRLVDVRELAAEGRALARLSASFTQGALTGEERFACRVGAYALDQDLSTLPSPLNLAWLQQNNSATGSRRAVLTNSQHWQDVSVELPITRETRYVMLHLAMVQEQPLLKSGSVQFRAHFMDDVKLEIVSDR
jgi:hypothetical protein